MIDFACRKFSLDEVMKCGFALSKADFSVLDLLIRRKDAWHTAESISKQLSLNITTVQRAVKRNFEKGLVLRSQNNLEGGGYIFLYKAKGKGAIGKLLNEIIGSWHGHVEKELLAW